MSVTHGNDGERRQSRADWPTDSTWVMLALYDYAVSFTHERETTRRTFLASCILGSTGFAAIQIRGFGDFRARASGR